MRGMAGHGKARPGVVWNYRSKEVLKMRTIQIVIEDSDYKKLEKQKGGKSWRDYILSMAD